MAQFFSTHKKLCIIACVILAALFLTLYLYAAFLPGVWHRDAFLYRQKDGSFIGSDLYAEYKMSIDKKENGADIDFSVNDITKKYTVKFDLNDMSAEISENDARVFEGKTVAAGDSYILIDNNNEAINMVTVTVGGVPPKIEELFPNYTRVFSLAVADKYDVRGNLMMLFLILLFAAILFLDIKFPNFFWILEHRMDVDGGEPSDWYRFGQGISRVILAIGIVVCVVLTFTTH